ncbi:MAG: DUF423 domain-containing protein [Bacteroidota bacterium]|jgi:uncharacterized membrane protein YgdD (TMEM256/DUF423 family)
MNKKITLFAIFFICSAIILGAFGAHALKNVLSLDKLTSFETGVKYQMYNGLALLILGLSVKTISPSKFFFNLNILGSFLFSFSIYLLCLNDYLAIPKLVLVPLTPIGGGLLITSWIILFISIWKNKQ